MKQVKSPWRNRIVGYSDEEPDQLLANPSNWRIHPAAQQNALSGVLKEIGLVQNIIANRTTGNVVDGHLRITLAMREGQPTVPVTWVDLTEEEELYILATIDPVSAMATADAGALDALLSSVNSGEAAVTAMLAELAESAGLYAPGEDESDAEPQIDRAEELREQWGVESGQMWRLPSRTAGQEHRIYCGDSTDRDTIKELYGAEFADMVFTDPPYGTMATGRGGKSISGDQTYNAVLGCFDMFPIVLKPGAPIYVMGGTFNLPMVYKLFDISFRQVPTLIVWDKEQFVLRHHDYHNQWEAIFYSWRPCEGSANDRWHGDRKQSDVWRFSRDSNSDRVHITQKPVELAEKAITNSSPIGGVVWEPFSGSASTIIAAENLSRQCRAVEISPAYVAVALQRYADAFGIEPELITDGD